ncbi:tetratricopeptide repeat protein [Algoriphagus mannitolivorans]|uniref:tetratricopeptide repeat protein n=1 Tax=Algoriphagus mannitolivorans TaxID=226504 RepID=UPI000407A564|nr:tetratricopeptide repeat protein [Algoriphagus mannitolivorans]
MDQDELFRNYLQGKLSPSDKSLLEKLLEENPRYQAELELFRKTWKTPESSGSRVKSILISIVIALIIVAAGVFLFYTFALPQGPKLFSAYYEPYPVDRLISQSQNPKLKQGLEAYQAQRFDQATSIFEQLLAQSESDQVLFHLGLSHLASGRPEKAIPIFSLISKESPYSASIAWYKALGYLQMNKIDEAKAQLKIASSAKGEFSNKATELLDKLK